MMGILRLQLDLLQAKTDTGRLGKSVSSDIDALLDELNETKLEIDTGRNLNPLVPIRHLIKTYFTLEEIDDLAFDTGINPGEIAGDTISEKAMSLVMYADGNNQLALLLRTCEIKRPLVDWPPVPDAP
jgi:hypothetical protein